MADDETTETTAEDETTTSTDEETTETTATTETDVDWKSHSRKHERTAKAERKKREELEARLAEIESQNQTEAEKAVAKAREEAKAEALSEAQQERRHDRLEVASTRIATKGITVKDDDGKDAVLRFADPDDALVYVERAIRAGDIDEDDIFDTEGKVNTDALSEALQEILTQKPHLLANGNGNTPPKVKGSADAGKGSGSGKDEESLTPSERFERLQQKK